MLLLLSAPVWAFCGTFVGAAGSDLRNHESQVVIARYDGRTSLTLAADYEGDLSEFALLVPVPEVGTCSRCAARTRSTTRAPARRPSGRPSSGVRARRRAGSAR